MIKVIIKDTTRNGQKFTAEALKNSLAENSFAEPLMLLNSPPVRKALRMKDASIEIKKPVEKEDNKLVNVTPISAKTSILIPLISFSVIMLFPISVSNEAFNGRATRITGISDENQTIRIPFHDFSDRKVAFLTAIIIFIIMKILFLIQIY
jgi:hypothetical protein